MDASLATKGMWTGAGAGFVGFLVQANWIGIMGFVPVVLDLLVNTWVKPLKARLASKCSRGSAAHEQPHCGHAAD
ncbi:hypothetical protein RPPX_05925 [Pseudomonas putida S12]|uniref:Uncharacterized protein n=2 Tax=Pseudomonas putida TaxID=303 RepID=A0AA34RSW9_PSEPU|nr:MULTISPECIES: hypothetical protein [Pseudomonas]AJA12906.1 hypothetical protein RPPX_05925 [Pseudomonas putida S12]MBI6884913.1 holin [Pseudomonas putida]USX38752.1 holin [Pseudomonas putida]